MKESAVTVENSGRQEKPSARRADVAVLTAGRDKPYALGLADALVEKGIPFEFLGSGDVDSPQLHNNPLITFRNPRGDQAENAALSKKVTRVLKYYVRLLWYAVNAQPRVFHILWNNKLEWFDRTFLMLFYRICGRKIAYTAHNVNMRSRDGNDSFLNRLTLRIQYRLADHIFVHTQQMKGELQDQFQVPPSKVSVIPFGMNSTVPDTTLNRTAARTKLGLSPHERVLLFYGYIAPYKGLDYLYDALSRLPKNGPPHRLVIAGQVKKNGDAYWSGIQQTIQRLNLSPLILSRIEFIPDEDTEIYFKAADALVLPYTFI